ncbi:MAG: phosphopantetheine-binding protein [Candidatus Nanoarchaeia archaeon]
MAEIELTGLKRLEIILKNPKNFDSRRDISDKDITPETKFRDLGFDSLDLRELAYHVEREFEVVIPDGIICDLEKAGDYLDYISKYEKSC